MSWLAGLVLRFGRGARETAEFAALKAIYRRWEVGLTATWLLVLLPAAAIAVWRILTRVAATRYASLGRAEIGFFPGGVEFGFPAVFLGAVISLVLLWLGVRLHLGPRYVEYDRYEELKWGIPRWAPAAGLFALFAASSAGAAALLDCYAVFTADPIRVNEVFSVGGRAYRYADVRAIRTAPKWVAPIGNEVARREYVICFRDGSAWSTNWAPGSIIGADRLRLGELVSRGSGLEVVELAVLARKDQSCR